MQGQRHIASSETLVAVLAALGAPITSPGDVPAALRERRARRARTLMEPVLVAWNGALPALEIRLAGPHPKGLASASFQLEGGDIQSLHRHLDDLPLVARGRSAHLDGEQVLTYRWDTRLRLPWGFHRLHVQAGGRQAQVHVISAPVRAYAEPPGRAWGSFLPTYALRGADDWGCGDYSLLQELVRWTGEAGGQSVATLPLLPAFLEDPLFEPSPYSPTSRQCWNELFIDPTREPEFASSDAARQLMESAEWAAERSQLSNAETLDYRRLWALKRPVLEAMASRCAQQGGQRMDALSAFLRERPQIAEYARFRAAVDMRQSGWQLWPERMQAGNLRASDHDPQRTHFWGYAQWVSHLQLKATAELGAQTGTGLLLDLPLGVHGSGFDTWRHPQLFAHRMSAGAPPDTFFTKGQSWGFPPRIPDAVRADGYRDLAATLRHHLELASTLRMDHVMSLHRLYWVPHGMDATQGVYVRTRAEEQYAVLCLESHRHRASIVGEDLGTVPRTVRSSMQRHNITRLGVMQFDLAGGGPSLPNPSAMTSLNTHDTPTFEAFRRGLDIDDLLELGLFTEAGARDATQARSRLISDLRRWLRGEGLLSRSPPESEPESDSSLALACLTQLARGSSPLVLVSLEDLWQEARPHNVPGTHRERPNWRRRALFGPEAWRSDPDLQPRLEAALKTLSTARRQPFPSAAHEFAESPNPTVLTAADRALFRTGRHLHLHERLGASRVLVDEVSGLHALCWSSGAQLVELEDVRRGRFFPMESRGDDLWEVFVPGRPARPSDDDRYRFRVSAQGQTRTEHDPAARHFPIGTGDCAAAASRPYRWGDESWCALRGQASAPPNVLELPAELWGRQSADTLCAQILEFVRGKKARNRPRQRTLPCQRTLVVLPRLMESRELADGSQLSADFAPDARLGTPHDVMRMVDSLHQADVGVLLTWPPAGTSLSAESLAALACGDSEEVRRGKAESFLLSSADFWLDVYHFDGLRILPQALRERAGSGNSLLQTAEIMQRLRGVLAQRHPHAIMLTGSTKPGPGTGAAAPLR